MRPAARGGRVAAIGCFTLPFVAAVLIFVGTVAGAPPEHDVTTMGGRSIPFRTATPDPQAHVYGPIAPTTSLGDARCQAWRQNHSGACPDDSALAGTYWPALQPSDRTLYVGVAAYCDPESNHFNLELGRGASLVLHCHYAARWVNLERPPAGVVAEPIITLLIVSTATWSPGRYSIYREDRLERWLDDQVTTTLLGTVTV
jgi:hypothetical protein